MSDFEERNRVRIREMAADDTLRSLTTDWFDRASSHEYSYHFTWLGRPIIQFPQDIVATQEIIWRTEPDLIIETGIARGGSLILSASILELIGGDGLVVGIDIDIREHNRTAIESHRLANRIRMVEGSSVDPTVVTRVREIADGRQRIMVMLDSMHSHAHVLAELKAYSPLVTAGCYLLVFDTIVEQMREDAFPDRPWGRGDNPATALSEFLATNDRFEVDETIEKRLLVTVAPGGYLRCVKD
jgi:cephalosporin hydroxylase